METQEPSELVVLLEGPAPFLDVVFETIEAHVQRTGEEYEEIITGVDAEDAGDVDHEEEAVLHLYVLASEDPEDIRELIGLALDRIADENNMDLARQSVRIMFDEEEAPEEI